MKILILVLHSRFGIYNDLMKIQEEYLNKISNKNISWYKYYFEENIENSYIDEKKNNIIIKGKESYNPGCRIKTYESFKLIKNKDYDYLIRINEATIVNYKLLNEILNKHKPTYAGAINIIQEGYTDNKSGIFDYRYKAQKYMSGRCIIIKKNMIDNILDHLNKNNIDNVIDDLSIGIIINKYDKKKKKKWLNLRYLLGKGKKKKKKWLNLRYLLEKGNKKYVRKERLIYTHKSNDRNNDLKFMKNTIKFVLKGNKKKD